MSTAHKHTPTRTTIRSDLMILAARLGHYSHLWLDMSDGIGDPTGEQLAEAGEIIAELDRLTGRMDDLCFQVIHE